MNRTQGTKTEKQIAGLKRSRQRWRTFALVSFAYALLATCVLISMLILAKDSGRSLFPKDAAPQPTYGALSTPDPDPSAAPLPTDNAVSDAAPDASEPTIAPEASVPPIDMPETDDTNDTYRVTLLDAYVRALSQENDSYPDMLVALVQNDAANAEMVSATIAFAAFDAQGARIAIANAYSEEADDVFRGEMGGLLLAPGASYGENYGWRLRENHGIARVEACVVSAEFADGTKWVNPEYALWASDRV